jgi:hypothetical protein
MCILVQDENSLALTYYDSKLSDEVVKSEKDEL